MAGKCPTDPPQPSPPSQQPHCLIVTDMNLGLSLVLAVIRNMIFLEISANSTAFLALRPWKRKES